MNTVAEPRPAPESPDGPGSRRSVLNVVRQFLLLFGIGFLGVLSLIPMIAQQIRRLRDIRDLDQLPETTLIALSLVQPSVLLAIGVAVGLWLAPRLGLRSHLAERTGAPPQYPGGFRREAGVAIFLGIATGIVLTVLDLFFLSQAGADQSGAAPAQNRTLAVTLMGLLYGGITEELMMRWGLMTFLAWLAWHLVQRDRGRPRAPVVWTSIVLAAFLFGAGHLGAVAVQAPLTGLLVARTVLLNTLAGVTFGWLFWRYSLEAAMLAHATVHVVFTVASWSGLSGG